MEQESSNRAVKIVAIIGGVIVIIVASCGVLGYFGIKAFKETVGKAMETVEAGQDLEQSRSAADTFLTYIQSNDLDGAYQSTSATFKKQMPQKEFDDLLKKHSALKEPATNMGWEVNLQGVRVPPTSPQGPPTTYRYQYRAQSKDGKDSIEFTLTVSKEGGTMKVDQLTITKANAPAKDGSKDSP
jgi:hypothetical protein